MSVRDEVTRRLDNWLPDRKPDECWVPPLKPTRSGYIRTSFRGQAFYLHRLVYIALVGDPGEQILDHVVCDNKPCCNPAHLEPTTQRKNILRGTAPTAANAAKTHCIRGHEFNEVNTYVCTNPDGSTRRICRPCNSALSLRRYHEKRRGNGSES